MNRSPASHEDWAPSFEEDDDGRRFKWGWNAETKEAVVWEVGGPGDGSPFHQEYLEEKWGRPPSVRGGDALGLAYWVEAVGDNRLGEIAVEAYYGDEVPAEVLVLLSAEFPEADVRVITSN